MKIICPNCGRWHNNRFSADSDWCQRCAGTELENQDTDLELGQTFGQ